MIDIGDYQELLDAILSKMDVDKLDLSQSAPMFANLSRFFAMHSDLNEDNFSRFKHDFTMRLANEPNLSVENVLALVIPVAAEEMNNSEVWDKFADTILSNEHKIETDLFQSCCNLTWAFSKINY